MTGCSPVDLAISHFPQSQRAKAQCIIAHESRGDPGAVSPTNDHGIFQINAVHRSNFQRVTGSQFYNGVYDPFENGQYAAWLWRQQGWSPWTSSRYC
jgi:hypothetical protein